MALELLLSREYDIKERIPHTWLSSNNIFNCNFSTGLRNTTLLVRLQTIGTRVTETKCGPMLKITCTCHGIYPYIENNYHREQGFALLPHILLLLSNVEKVLLVLFNLLSLCMVE